MSFSESFKELRKESGLTQAEFAQKFNVAAGTVGMWETGKREPNFETTLKIADFFDVPVDRLLGREPAPPGDVFALSSDADYDDLPPEAIKEIEQFKEFVKSKYKKSDK